MDLRFTNALRFSGTVPATVYVSMLSDIAVLQDKVQRCSEKETNRDVLYQLGRAFSQLETASNTICAALEVTRPTTEDDTREDEAAYVAEGLGEV